MRTILLSCVFAACSWADVIQLTGIVTSIELDGSPVPGLPPVQVGDTYQAWVGFEVWNSTTREPWIPQGIRLSCTLGGSCFSDLPGHDTYIGGVGVTYSNGFFDYTASWGDGGLVEIDDSLNVVAVGTSSSFNFHYNRNFGPGNQFFRHTYYAGGSSYWRIHSTVEDFPTHAQIPEPAAFLLAAPALLAILALRRRK